MATSLDHLDPADLAARFRQALMPLVRQLRTNVEEGMTPGLMSALATVARQGPIALGDLASVEKISPPMATKTAVALEERGLVERQPCVDDKRVVRLALTPDGRALLDRSHKRRNTWLAERIDALPEAERASLAAAITVIEHLNQEEGG